jgi:hypothetical protein
LKSPIILKVNYSLLANVIIIVFIFIYLAMIAHSIETKHPFLKTLTDLAQIVGGLAALIASYLALIGVSSWKNSEKYNRIIEFKKLILNCERLFNSVTDIGMLIRMRKTSGSAGEMTTDSQELLKRKEQQIIELLSNMRAEASTIDLLCQDRGYNKKFMLDQLARKLSSDVNIYFNYNNDTKFYDCESNVTNTIGYIFEQIEVYESKINV